ncbi:molecular chaperone DnaJ [Acidocella aquatica]|uniref:Molecular chaperone DnaJ n=1 Tax=Acidocella aquatica TaxID=1922313 RepID=A0ABQ6AE03_9PROT|nr:J domain-containing protein [Acidocella aquatica]GLR68339.1 molecular chaperone DnaJ [Acidocella aquatica]
MADDPYKILGVAKDATPEQIRAAYRKLAKKHHPDLNPGNKAAEEAFKSASAANELLSDSEKRARYDRGEIDASGAERAPQGFRQGPGGAGAGGFGGGNFEDIFASMFEQRGRPAGPARGQDARYALTADFLEAVNGTTKRLTLPDGQTLDVKIPHGTTDGDVLRLRGRGQPGRNGGPAGDALIEITVAPHKFFRREGQNIRMDLPISLREAVLGGKITLPTPAGPVALSIKPHSDTGTEMRLRGRGVPAHSHHHAGDLLVKLRVTIGPADAALEDFLKTWEQPDFDPRAGMTV